MTPDEAIHLIKREHDFLHSKLFPEGTARARLSLVVITDDDLRNPGESRHKVPMDSGYHRDSDVLQIAICKADLEDDTKMNGHEELGIEPVWKRELWHEVMHEFQAKCVPRPTAEGIRLNQNARPFAGNGHDATFHTAIVECATRLQLTPEQLEGLI